MAIVLIQPEAQSPEWRGIGSLVYLRIYASQSFYGVNGEYVTQGQVGSPNWYQQYECPVVDGFIQIPEVSLQSTTDSTIPNVRYTAQFFTAAGAPINPPKLAQFFVGPYFLPIPAASSVLVSLAGTDAANNTYTARGLNDLKPYYTIQTEPDPDNQFFYTIVWDSSLWQIRGFGGELLYYSADNTDYPWQVITWTSLPPGIDPVPTVAEDANVLTTTWEQIIISNQGSGTPGLPFQFQAPFLDATQTEQLIIANIGANGGAIPFASNNTAGKTKLDTAPAAATNPVAIGSNSAVITDITDDITSLDTLKAPKASPTFTGTVTVTGNITATTTIAATGNVTGANLSGTNTGNVTKSGENYLSLTGQALTANAVNLSGTNVTGTLADARMPALTGAVTSTAGTVATALANNAVSTNKILNANVTNVKIAAGVDAVKIADGSVSNTAFQYINSLSSNAQTQLTALDTDKAPKASPTFTGTVTVPTPANGDSSTKAASTAFVQGLGLGAKVYMATLTQSSTSAPVATVLNNTLGGTLVWTRSSTGIYVGTFASPFTANKTQVFIGSVLDGVSFFGRVAARRGSSSTVQVETAQVDVSGGSIVPADDLLSETAITVLVGV